MTKRKIEIAVDYPDCEICGKEIEPYKVYIKLKVEVGECIHFERDGGRENELDNIRMNICMNCIRHPGKWRFTFQEMTESMIAGHIVMDSI